jgi:hypothetical protein
MALLASGREFGATCRDLAAQAAARSRNDRLH